MMFLKRLCFASSAVIAPALICSLTSEWSSRDLLDAPAAQQVAAAVADVGEEGERPSSSTAVTVVPIPASSGSACAVA